MFVRVILLTLAFSGVVFTFMQCYDRIDRSTYALVGRTILKLVTALMFGAFVVAACGFLSTLTN